MKKLRKRLRKLHHQVARTQRVLRGVQRVRDLARDKGLKATAKRLGAVCKRLAERAKNQHRAIREVEQKIEDAKPDIGGREAYVAWLNSVVGAVEGGTVHREIVAFMQRNGFGGGIYPPWAWCSATVAYGLCEKGGLDPNELPAGPWYSGAWLTWSGGHRVSYSDAIPGDLLIFDWGDGGITDHVATYVGNGIKIGGNENDRIEKDAVPVSNIVGVVRVNW